ncbi:MAG: BrnA antitoxin family protein [Novosphingobium sp.]
MEIARAVPFTQAFPQLARTIRTRGEQQAPTKVRTSIRLSRDVLDHFRKTGSGWQGRLDTALKEWIASR